jgi:type VI secretion system protein ImpG
MVNLQDDLVDYYRREMSYLRESGDHFAQRYPKVAQRLSFNGSESKDPHTERLLESFAFLTARVQREIDREFPMAAMAVLENICPNLTQPSPSMSVVHMQLDCLHNSYHRMLCRHPHRTRHTTWPSLGRDTAV